MLKDASLNIRGVLRYSQTGKGDIFELKINSFFFFFLMKSVFNYYNKKFKKKKKKKKKKKVFNR